MIYATRYEPPITNCERRARICTPDAGVSHLGISAGCPGIFICCIIYQPRPRDALRRRCSRISTAFPPSTPKSCVALARGREASAPLSCLISLINNHLIFFFFFLPLCVQLGPHRLRAAGGLDRTRRHKGGEKEGQGRGRHSRPDLGEVILSSQSQLLLAKKNKKTELPGKCGPSLARTRTKDPQKNTNRSDARS